MMVTWNVTTFLPTFASHKSAKILFDTWGTERSLKISLAVLDNTAWSRKHYQKLFILKDSLREKKLMINDQILWHHMSCLANTEWLFIPRPNEVGEGYTGFTLSVRPSVHPSVCRRHGFRSISQDSFGISISNFTCMLMVAIGRSLLIFSDITFKMAAWWPYWIFWFPDSNRILALNINFKLQRHNNYVYG